MKASGVRKHVGGFFFARRLAMIRSEELNWDFITALAINFALWGMILIGVYWWFN
jgi:hypothetical protein